MSKDEEEEQSRGFKVADRRRFVDHADAGEATDAAAASEAPASAPEQPPESPPQAPADARAHEHEALPEMTFSTFVISLLTQTLMHLGEIADPEGQAPARDLPAAKQMIDLLGILRDKTKGNLDASEEQLLGSMLYDLRMRYVEVSRGS
jgi:hypothetical protein